MEYLPFFFGAAGLLGFLGTIITLLATKNKNKAETEKIKLETEEKMIALQAQLQDQIIALVEQGKKDYEEREKERVAKRNEFDSLHKGQMQLREELQSERSRNIQLMSEKADMEKLIRRLESTLIQINKDVTTIKKNTGQLPGMK